MGVVKRTNKKYDYKPRYYNSDKEGSPYKMGNRFDEYRTTIGRAGGVRSRFNTAWDDLQASRGRGVNKIILIAIAILVLLFLWIIDFDLSIFQGSRIIDID